LSDVDEVTAANTEFYAAIESGDLGRVEAVWDDAEDVACVHPGCPPVRGRSRVVRSWAVIMANTAYIQFFPTGAEVAVTDDIAVVACEHSVLARTTDTEVGLGETARVVATNVFRRRDSGWRLWAHHASPVMTATDDGELT
jgi:ketosteroid isomerase-like protein